MSVPVPLTPAQALELLAECFGAEASDLTPSRRRETIVGWDSMGALMLIAELDDRFSLELTAEASRAMATVGDALEFLRKHGVLQEVE